LDGRSSPEAPTHLREGPTHLRGRADIVRALIRLGDTVDPRSGSILFLGGTRGSAGEPFHPAFLNLFEERVELVRRLSVLAPRERLLLFLWYVEGWPVERIAERLAISRVHCYRLRAKSLSVLAVDQPRGSEPDQAASTASTSLGPRPQALP